MVERTKHERILLERPARVFIEKSESDRHGRVVYENYCLSRDLSISGICLSTSALLRVGTKVQIDLEVRHNEILNLNGEVIRRIEFGDREQQPGYAVAFGTLSPKSHETLLRYFVTDRIAQFTKIFLQHFPHLSHTASEQDLALVVNLWEDQRHRIVEETRVASVKNVPAMFSPPQRQPARPMPAPEPKLAKGKKPGSR